MTNRNLKSVFCFLLIFTTYEAFAQDCDLDFSLGNDTTINCNSSITLTGPDSLTYLWSTGAVTQTIEIGQAGTYSLQIINQQGTEVTNGDFSDGTNGFSSDYVIGTGGAWGQLSLEGTYAVSSNPNNVHTNFSSCYDHTSGDASGAMLIVNGAGIANQDIWTQTIAVTPNTNYLFSIWGMSATSGSPGQLNFSINGDQIGETFNLSSTTCVWENFFTSWESGANTSATIAIVNQNTATSGNDFALDDITFAPICSFADTIVVSLPPAPVLTVSENQTICSGDSITLTATSSIPGSTFQWQPGGLTGSEITIAPTASVQYTAIATSPQACNSTAQSVIITVQQGPAITILGTDTICPGEEISLTASANSPGITYQWEPGDLSGNSIDVAPDETTEYTVTGTPVAGCPSEESFTVNIRNTTVSISGIPLICTGRTIQLVANSDYSEFGYDWSPGNLNGDTISVSPAETTTYAVSATSDAGCVAEAEYTVEVEDPVLTVTGNAQICPGDTAFLSATVNFPGFTFQWTPGPFYGANVAVSPASTTTYTISGGSSQGCSAQSEFTVELIPIPDVEISGPDEICKGEILTLTASSSAQNPSYSWNTGSTQNPITDTPNQTTTYSVVAFDGICSSDSAYKTVIVKSLPYASPPNDTLVCPLTPLTVYATSNMPNSTFVWSPTGQTGDTITIDPVVPGYYSVTAESNGCTSNDSYFSVELLESCGCTLEMPNIFTPNGDGKNDSFGPLDDDECHYTAYKLQVFNRWGKEVFSTTDATVRWDGEINGKNAAEGVYFWTFEYSYTDGSLQNGSESISGDITIANK